jgi:hypothetical protein
MKKEKAIEIISKLLKTASDKGATENEAMIAALKAQELMAKYDIVLTDIEEEKEEIESVKADTDAGHKWKYSLSGIIANNFCCKVFWTNNNRTVCFYGFTHNATIARDVFNFLYNIGNRFAAREYMNARNNGRNTTGLKNTYLIGFLHGIKSVLEKQCTALMIVIPEEVKKSYEDMKSGMNMRTMNKKMNYNNNKEVYDKGYTDGRNTANARYIEA